MSPPTTCLTVAFLAELEEQSGFDWFHAALRHEIPLVSSRRSYTAEKELKLRERQLLKLSPTLQRRFLKLYAWVSEQRGNFEKAAILQRKLGNAKEAGWLAFQATVATRVTALLQPGHCVRAIQPLELAQGIWAVFAVKGNAPGEVLVVQKTSNGWRRLDSVSLSEETEGVVLVCLGKELLVIEDQIGGSWQPTQVTSYQLRMGKLHPTKEFFSEHGVRLRKFDGRWTLSTFHCIGYRLCHGEQPRWLEVFQQGKNGWQAASAKYPELFEDYPHQIRSLLKRYPKDDVLPVYLHWAERLLQGKPVGPPPQKHAQKIDT